MSDPRSLEIFERLSVLEAESDIRRVIARYFQICDDLGPHTPLKELGQLFTADARWEGKGRYEKAFGGYDGREAIVTMMASYCAPTPHFKMTGHFYSAEHIKVTGGIATGEWMMLQCSTYADDRSDLRSARLNIDFKQEDSNWRMSHFRSTNIFARRVEGWSDTADIPVPENAKLGASK